MKKLFTVVGILLITICASAQNRVEVDRDYTQDVSKIKKSYGIKLSDTIANSPLSVNYTIFDKKLQNIYGFSPLPSASISGTKRAEYPSFVGTATLKYPIGLNTAILYQPDIFKGTAAENNTLAFSFSTSNTSEKEKLMTYDLPEITGKSATTYPIDEDCKSVDQNNSVSFDVNYSHLWNWGEMNIDLFAKETYSTYFGLDYRNSQTYREKPPAENIALFNNLSNKKFIKNNSSHKYNTYGVNLNFKNTPQENSKVVYDLDVIYSHTEDKAKLAGEVYTWAVPPIVSNNYKLKENYIKTNLEGGPIIGKYSMVTLGASSESVFYTGMQKFNATLLNFSLQYQLLYKGWAFNLGAKGSLNFNNLSGWDHYHTYIMPKADVSYALMENKLWLYGSIEGNNYLNSYSSLLEITDWVYPGTAMRESSVPVEALGGLKGVLTKDVTFDINAGFAKHKGLLQFKNIERVEKDIIRSPLDAYYSSHNEVFLSGSLIYQSKNLELGGKFRVSQFSKYTAYLEYKPVVAGDFKSAYRDEPALGKPKFEAELFGEYNIRERIFLGANADIRGKVVVYNRHILSADKIESIPIYAKSYVNLSVYGKYVIDSNTTVFVQAGNILNAKIQHYGMYRECCFNVGLGLLVKF